jgi:outer membrane protein assembly factor BamE
MKPIELTNFLRLKRLLSMAGILSLSFVCSRLRTSVYSTFASTTFLRLLSSILLGGVLSGCTSNQASSLIKTYRIDIQQGNIVVASSLAQLKPGMTQEQVKFILGSPLLTDPFHADRWDYVYRYQSGSGAFESNQLTIHFKNGLYTHYTGAAMPENKR